MFRIDLPFSTHAKAATGLAHIASMTSAAWPSPLPPTETLEKAWLGMDWPNKVNIGPFGTILFLFYIIMHWLEPF